MADLTEDACLDGRVAIVTGSSAGIGLDIAKELHRAGATVVINGRNPQGVADAVREVASVHSEWGGELLGFVADVARVGGAEAIVDKAIGEFGHLDILVNNAGRGLLRPTVSTSYDDWMEIVALNLTAPFVCSRQAAKAMIVQGSGVIVNIGSIFAKVGSPERSAYCSTKHGLLGLTRALASEWGKSGIRVCIVNPGYVETRAVRDLLDRGAMERSRLIGRIPTGRLAHGNEIGRAVRFLASDEAEYMNGAEVNIDGGWLSYSGW